MVLSNIRCKGCKAIILGDARKCPLCGAKTKSLFDLVSEIFKLSGWLFVIFVAFCAIILFWSKDKPDQSQKKQNEITLELPAWRKNPELPSNFNAADLKGFGEKICVKAVEEKTVLDFYEGCYKYILKSISRIEQLNAQHRDDTYVNYIYPVCYYSGSESGQISGAGVVNANVVKACLDVQSSYAALLQKYADKFGEEKVATIVDGYRQEIEEKGSWFPAYKKLMDIFGAPPK